MEVLCVVKNGTGGLGGMPFLLVMSKRCYVSALSITTWNARYAQERGEFPGISPSLIAKGRCMTAITLECRDHLLRCVPHYAKLSSSIGQDSQHQFQ